MKTHHFYFLSFFLFGCLLFTGVSCQKERIDTSTFIDQTNASLKAEQAIILRKHLNSEQLDSVLLIDEPEEYKAFLGQVLFYDSHLSADKSVSCASCHQQQFAFADNVAFSRGANGNRTDRNSIGLGAFDGFAAHYGEIEVEKLSFPIFVRNFLFWDERAPQLEDQMLETFANPKEMGMELTDIPARVEELEYAKTLHNKAFEGKPVTIETVIASLEAFINRIESKDAPFDQALGQLDTPFVLVNLSRPLEPYFDNFNESENNGKRLFLENCASCHAFSLGEIFRSQYNNLTTATSNGLDVEYADKGIGSHTNRASDNGVFKIPGLRNIALTAPYMHDGRFANLEEVVDFYSTGIQPHPNLDRQLKFSNGAPIKMEFNEHEKADLIAFLNTLTSASLPSDVNFSDPFK